MKKRLTITMTTVLALLLMLGSSVYAFTDTKGDPNEPQIVSLQKAGILNGLTIEHFAPKSNVTMAQAVVMLVKAFDLNIAHMQFIKEPKASDTFTKVPDDAWYAQAFLYASLNGVPIPSDADPMQTLTKEQYAHLLYHALIAKGDYAFVKMFVVLKDEQEVTKDYMNSIQNLLLGKMTELDNGYFYPKRNITRSEAARMLHAAIQFSKDHEPLPGQPAIQPNIQLNVTKVNDEVNKVTLVWSDMPNPGYRLEVAAIEFRGDGHAVITYAVHEPEPGKFYPQVITEGKVDTFISSAYTPVLNNPI